MLCRPVHHRTEDLGLAHCVFGGYSDLVRPQADGDLHYKLSKHDAEQNQVEHPGFLNLEHLTTLWRRTLERDGGVRLGDCSHGADSKAGHDKRHAKSTATGGRAVDGLDGVCLELQRCLIHKRGDVVTLQRDSP